MFNNTSSGHHLSIDELMSASSPTCPVCGSNEDDIIENVKAGCAHCYVTFAHILNPHIERMHALRIPEPPPEYADLLRDYPTFGDIAVSTRIRLARNLSEFPFPGAMNESQQLSVFEQVGDFLGGIAEGDAFRVIDISDMKRESPFEAASLLERHLISKDLFHKRGVCGAAISPDEKVSVMINEEDHLRIQALGEGLSLFGCLETVGKLETMLSDHFDFASDKDLGWLTRCPTNLGTGIRASVMLHLPAHTDSGSIHGLTARLAKSGYTIRGFYGEGTKPVGRLYQISNQQTMGLTIRQIVENLNALVLRIITREREIQHALDDHHPGYIDDHVWRAFGILTNARSISGDEAMQLLSAVRVGISIGELNVPIGTIDSLIHRIQPNTLCFEAGRDLSEPEMNSVRATVLRKAIKSSV
ncbi:MAG: ATP--guanido phosphotransferase [Oscillospiraceae bacterium]|jgi:protein arginine kinase|nr:ATP--guanido phosphotransferase [Oscillospiraceae bacterium]